jgi:hypothetical protein
MLGYPGLAVTSLILMTSRHDGQHGPEANAGWACNRNELQPHLPAGYVTTRTGNLKADSSLLTT